MRIKKRKSIHREKFGRLQCHMFEEDQGTSLVPMTSPTTWSPRDRPIAVIMQLQLPRHCSVCNEMVEPGDSALWQESIGLFHQRCTPRRSTAQSDDGESSVPPSQSVEMGALTHVTSDVMVSGDSVCCVCRSPIQEGEPAIWQRGRGTLHHRCAGASLVHECTIDEASPESTV